MYRLVSANNVHSLLLTAVAAADVCPFDVDVSTGTASGFAINVPGLAVISLIGETETGVNSVIEIVETGSPTGDTVPITARGLYGTDAQTWPIGSKLQIRFVNEHVEQLLRLVSDAKAANLVFAGPSTGANAAPTYRSLVANDLPNIQNMNGLLTVGKGGTGVTTVTAGSILIGDGTDPMVELAGGSAGDVLTWDGSAWVASSAPTGTAHSILSATHADSTAAAVTRGALITGQGGTPKWAKLAIGTANYVLKSDGTDISWGQVSLTAGVTGTLAATNGGTGQATATTGDMLYASAANTWSKVAIGTINQVLSVNGTGLPVWQSLSALPVPAHNQSAATITSGILAQSVGGTGLSSYSPFDMLYASGAGNLTTLPIGSNGQVLTISGGAPAWTAAGAGTGTVTSVNIGTSTTGLTATGGPITISGSIVLGGTLAVAHGGTNQTSYTAGDILYATAGTTLAKLGIGTVGQVLTVAGGIPSWASAGAGTVTSVDGSGGTTGLTLTGGPITISGTLTLGGVLTEVNGGTNQSSYATGDIIYASGVNTLGKLAAGTDTHVLTLAGGVPTWAASAGVGAHDLLSVSHTDTLPVAVTEGALIIGNATPKWSSLVIGAANRVLRSSGTTASWAQVALATDVSGTLPVGNGGTGITSGAVGDIFYFSGVSTVSKLSVGTNGYVLTLAAGVPSWAAATGTTLQYFKEAAAAPSTAPLASGSTQGVAIGDLAVSAGTRSIAVGYGRSFGQDTFSASIGNNTTTYGASGNYAVALGLQAKASGHRGFAAGGTGATATGNDACAIGSVTASGTNAFAAGGTSNAASGTASITLGGNSNSAAGTNSVALAGNNNTTTSAATGSVSMGAGQVSGVGSANIMGSATAGAVVAADGAISLAALNFINNWKGAVTMGQNGTPNIFNSAITNALTTWSSAAPALFIAGGSANSNGNRANVMIVTYDSRVIIGGQHVSTEAAGNTGIIELGTSGSLFAAKITSAAHAAHRTYTLRDTGANADVIVSTYYKFAFAAKTGTYTATENDVYLTADTTGGAFQITLPDAASIAGRTYKIKKIDASANNLTVAGTGGDTIDGAASKVWNTQNQVYIFVSDGTNWLLY